MTLKTDYLAMLQRLPIDEPRVEKVRVLFPHLAADEISAVLTWGKDSDSRHTALPPLRVDGAFQIVSLNGSCKTIDGTVLPQRLSWAQTGRTRESYGAKAGDYDDAFRSYRHMEKAIQFAQEQWASDLILDDWSSFIEIYVQDPTDLHEAKFSTGKPKTKAVVGFTTARAWNDLINDHSKPRSQVIDDAIAQITTDKHIAEELRGGRGQFIEHNCAYDGAGLGLSSCGECGKEFKYDGSRGGSITPLSAKITGYLIAQGFQFGQDPEIARRKEGERYKELLIKREEAQELIRRRAEEMKTRR